MMWRHNETLSRPWAYLVVLAGVILAVQASITDSPPPKPPMGFNNWARFMCDLNETLFVKTADAMQSKGLLHAGYNRLNLDDCWMQHSRAKDGSLQWNTTLFPNGIPWLMRNVTSRGFHLGIYGDVGFQTCGGYPGSQGYEELDAKTFASWNVSYVKLDGCNVTLNAGQTLQDAHKRLYGLWHKVLSNLTPKMMFSESAPAYFSGASADFDPQANKTVWHRTMEWVPLYGELARHSVDVAVYGYYNASDYWKSIMKNYAFQVQLARYQRPGFYNDPDFLVPDYPWLSLDEKKSHFALWASFSAPLIISANIQDLLAEEVAYLTNKDIIDVDQDPLGLQATLVSQDGAFDVLTKGLSNGDRLLTVLNRGNMTAYTSLSVERIGLESTWPYIVKDLWTGSVTNVTSKIDITLRPHATAIYRFSNVQRPLATGMIFNTPTSKCLTASTGADLAFSSCTSSDFQVWGVSKGSVRPLSDRTKCITGGKTAGDHGLALLSCNRNNPYQQWAYHVSGNLRNVATKQCLTETESVASVRECGDHVDDQVFGLPSGVEVVRPD
jgi:alpha-galactosidase